ncbi:MAG: 30S ribosomal protein S2 [Thermoprotei archaeon]|nr:MAG: 30S ribosomal protein S2 [Thermoprotei archaeon]
MSSSSEKEGVEEKKVELLIPLEVYLAAGLHIGTHIKSKFLKPFIYRVRPDGLCVIDVGKIDERIRIAAKFLARYDPPKIAVVSSRQYGVPCVLKFCQLTGAKPLVNRFIPGSFTNPNLPTYVEPDVVLITDPRADEQALIEASQIGIPIVALCDTDNDVYFVDLMIPVNNKGRKALALTYWLLTRQVLRERGVIPPDADLPTPLEEFEAKVEEGFE